MGLKYLQNIDIKNVQGNKMALQSKLIMINFVVIKMGFKKENYPVAMHAIKCDFAILIKLLPYLNGIACMANK